MSNIKKNFAYNSFLSVSSHLINLVLFPYCARILGVERFGTINFTQNIVQYFLFLAAMGITHIGVREIAKQTDRKNLNKCYSSMFALNIIYTAIALLIYVPSIFIVDRFYEQKELFFLGGLQILFTTFTIEWFYRGIENFKYITIRSFAIRILYVISVFLFVKSSDDYVIFFALTVGMTMVNAIINFMYARKFVSFSFKIIEWRKYLQSSLALGAYSILTSMYTTFNVAYLGFVWDDIQVGYYTTAIKVYTIILGFYSAFTGVMLPRMAALIKQEDKTAVNSMIDKSFELLYTVAIPLVIFMISMAPEIITILAGDAFLPAAYISRIVVPMLFVVGVAQILSFQVIIPMGYDKTTLVASGIGAFIGIILNLFITTQFAAKGTCVTVVITELSVTGYYLIFVLQKKLIEFDYKILYKHLAYSIPYVLFCYVPKHLLNLSIYIELLIICLLCIVYFYISQKYLIKNRIFKN